MNFKQRTETQTSREHADYSHTVSEPANNCLTGSRLSSHRIAAQHDGAHVSTNSHFRILPPHMTSHY